MDRCGRSSTRVDSSNKGKEPCMSYCGFGRSAAPLPPGLLGCFSWPPRSYSCSFCKREFRSAQALGGHMNVHRREKARLRQSPPPGSPFHNPNPNCDLECNPCGDPIIPNLNMPPPPSSCTYEDIVFPVACAFPFMLSPETHFSSSSSPRGGDGDIKTIGALKAFCGITELKNSFGEGTRNGLGIKGSEVVRLDLDMKVFNDAKENLDLELRLGHI